MSDPEYCYPPSYIVLKNKLNIRDSDTLDRFERGFVAQRIAQGVPSGDFDLAHLRAIHRRLSADIFAQRAGEIIGDINCVHPFREGNGRTQPLYLEQLAARVGHLLDLNGIDRNR